mgnify:CR=1 FL=1
MWDGFPVTAGHALIIPRRHVASWFDTTPDEQRSLFELVARAREEVLRRHAAQGFNVGINVGRCAGASLPGDMHVNHVPR